jgi:TrmH family RNA methyltransferase
LKQITSIQNPFIKSWYYYKKRLKPKNKTFLIEEKREISLALKGGYELESILFYPEICTEIEAKKISSTTELIEISATVFQN